MGNVLLRYSGNNRVARKMLDDVNLSYRDYDERVIIDHVFVIAVRIFSYYRIQILWVLISGKTESELLKIVFKYYYRLI